MFNSILWVVCLLISFAMIVLAYKYYGKVGIFMWIIFATIVSNIQTVKLVEIFGIETALGNILYGTTFLATDALNLKYGEKIARKSILLGIITMILVSLFMTIALYYKPSANDFSQESLKVVFTLNLRITIASVIAFAVSQFNDTKLFAFLQKKYNKLWISNNLSTIISQIIDTVIFTLITYFGLLPFNVIIELMLSMLAFKVIVAIFDTPFLYIMNKIKPKQEL